VCCEASIEFAAKLIDRLSIEPSTEPIGELKKGDYCGARAKHFNRTKKSFMRS